MGWRGREVWLKITLQWVAEHERVREVSWWIDWFPIIWNHKVLLATIESLMSWVGLVLIDIRNIIIITTSHAFGLMKYGAEIVDAIRWVITPVTISRWRVMKLEAITRQLTSTLIRYNRCILVSHAVHFASKGITTELRSLDQRTLQRLSIYPRTRDLLKKNASFSVSLLFTRNPSNKFRAFVDGILAKRFLGHIVLVRWGSNEWRPGIVLAIQGSGVSILSDLALG